MPGGGGTSTQTTVQELAPEQRALLEPVLPIAKNILANPPQQFPGSAVAGFNPLQQQAQQMTLNAAQGMLPTLQQLPGQYQSAIQGMQNNINQFGQTAGGATQNLYQQFGNVQGTANQTANQVGQQVQGGTAALNPVLQNMLATMQGGNAANAGALNFLTSGAVLDPNANVALQAATNAAIRPFIQNYQQQILPGIASEAVANSGFGGTRQGIAEGIATQGLLRQTGDITASMANNAYNQGLGAFTQGIGLQQGQTGQNLAGLGQIGQLGQQQQQNNVNALLGAGGLTNQAAQSIMQGILGGGQLGLQAGQAQQQGLGQLIQGLGSAGNVLQQGLLPAQLTAGVGEQQYAMQQALLNEQVQRYVNEQLIPFSVAQDVAGLAFGIPGGTTKTTATNSGGGGGMQAMQMGMGALSLLPLLFGSDRRLKKDIKKLGTLSDGLGIYAFKYVTDFIDRIGLMADEVKAIYPEAVKNFAGFDHVNYALVPSWKG